jgi:glycosyltransferase involved in cell wall biosynthesis
MTERVPEAGAPRLSVITATFQAAGTIAALIRSLEQQEFRDFEWIVQDGGSTDDTRALVESAALPRVHYSSAPDEGIYDAFNRALDRARGEYILFLGADDRLMGSDVLGKAAAELDALAAPPEALLCAVVDDAGRPFVSRVSALTLVLNTVHHQGVLYRRSLFDGFRYRIDSKIVADYELNLLLKLQRRSVASTDLVLAECGTAGVSRTTDERRLYVDLHTLRRRHLPSVISSGLLVIGLANVARRGGLRRGRR